MTEKTKHFRTAAVFVAAAMVIQSLFVLFLTPDGLVRLYGQVIAQKSERVESDSSFSEYFELRRDISDCDMFFLGVNTTVADSYFTILDYLRFLKRSFEVTALAMPVGKATCERMNKCISSESISDFTVSFDELQANGRFSSQLLDFVKALYYFNQTLPPLRKLTVYSSYTDSVRNATLSRVSSMLMTNWGNASDEVTAVMSINDVDKFFSHITEHKDAFVDFLGEEEYARYMEMKLHYEAKDFDAWMLGEKIAQITDEKLLVVCNGDLLENTDNLDTYMGEICEKPSYVTIKYSNCRAIDHTGEVELNEIDMPFYTVRGTYFVSSEKLSSYRSFYRFVADPSKNESRSEIAGYLDSLSTPNFFVIFGSPAENYSFGEDATSES